MQGMNVEKTLAELVAIDSTSARSNAEIINLVARFNGSSGTDDH
jgi:hypothetical protein